MDRVKEKKILSGSPQPRRKKIDRSLPKTAAAPAYRFAVCAQYVKCSKPNCRCVAGQPHGPYFAAFWKENGRIRKRYIRLADVEQMRELSEQPRRLLQDIAKCDGYVRELRALVRDYEKLVKQFAGI